jgi:CrcB protein
VLGSFVIGYFGTLTLQSGKYATSDNVRLFVMVGICGGFTTFSSFSLQTFDLLRTGAWGRALANVALSVALCLVAVAAGHLTAQHSVARNAIAETVKDEYTSWI